MSRYRTAMGIGVGLAGVAVASNVAARLAERRNPPIGNFVDAGGVRLHYLRRGSGQSNVVIIHGNGSMVEEIRASGLLERAAQRHTVFAFDRPGFGHSERPRDRTWSPHAQAIVLLEAFDRLGIEKPVVVGHSWGTLVALAMALHDPKRLAGLVLVSGYYYPTARADALLSSPPAIPGLGNVISSTVSPVLGGLLLPLLIRKVFRPAPVPPRFKTEMPKSMMLRPSQLRASAEETVMMVPAASHMHTHYRDLRLPVTILAGAGDRIVSHDTHAVRLHREISQSDMVILQNEGHMLHHGAVGSVVAAIESIFGKTQATPKIPEPDSLGG